MKKLFAVILFFISFLSIGQTVNKFISSGGKILTDASGKILYTPHDANNFTYVQRGDWIPVNNVADNEIWILATDEGDRYTSFTCTVANSGTYNVQLIGGSNGTTVLSTYGATASGGKISMQIPSGTGKLCAEGYYTYKIRIYATSSSNAILTFTVEKHASTTTTINNWKIINFGTKGLTSLVCYLSNSYTTLVYANSYYCSSLTSVTYYHTTTLKEVILAKYMNKMVNFSNNIYSAFSGCSSLYKVTMPIQMNSLVNFGGTTTSSGFQNCTSLTNIELPAILNSLLYFGSGNGINGLFSGCTNLVSVTGATSMSSLNNMTTAYNNDFALTTIPSVTTYSTNSIPFSSVVRNMVTFNQPTLRCSSFLLTGTSNTVRSQLTTINIDWANSLFSGSSPQIDIRWNALNASTIDGIFTALPTVTDKTINVAGNPGAASCNTAIATAKGWTVIIS
ncbi:MAG: hypothetical protein HGB12_15295 [Bacteroidetes bacterium]|nr:hypothetical protein [Bacteroidota bacterium]